MADIKEYNEETQELFLRFLLSDKDLFARCQNIVKPEYFNLKYRKAVDLFVSHSNYSTAKIKIPLYTFVVF